MNDAPTRLLLAAIFCTLAWFCAAAPVHADDIVQPVVVRRQGDDGVHTYRIPGLATTPRGTLIAVFDVRHQSAADLPGDIDVGMVRSTDGGGSWSKLATILDFDRTEPDSRGNGVGDPAVLVDRKSGEIFVVALWSHGNRAWHGSGPGLSPDETGQLVMTRSKDDGLTWSPPVNLTGRIRGRDPKWQLFFNGPGRGVQLNDGTLVFAAQFRDADGTPHSCFIFSSDNGDHWTVSPPAIPANPPTSESQLAQVADGSLLLSMRDESRSGQRLWASFNWNDELASGKWSDPWRTVPDPTCMASLVAHRDGPLVYSHVNSPRERIGLAIRTSSDGGKSWSAGRVLDKRPCAYSCLSMLDNGSVGVLYECGDKHPYETLTFARFPLSWLAGNGEK
jgi:sialidase-1